MQSASALLPPSSTTFEWLTPDTVAAAPLRAGVAWWRSARANRPYPARQDMHPRQMRGLLPYMSLVRVVDDGADFEHRIVGDVMVRAFSVQIQNRRFSEIAGDAPDFIARCYSLFRLAVETAAPVAWRSIAGFDNATIVITHGEVILLPLGRTKVDHVLALGSQWSGPDRN
jgi:hypothetical protein